MAVAAAPAFRSIWIGAALLLSFACTRERPVARDSAGLVDSTQQESSRRLATDATFSYVDLAGLGATLRAAADSFGVRDAVRVIERTTADTSVGASPSGLLDRLSQADLVVDELGGVARWVRPGGATWYLTFASDGVVLAHRDSLPEGLAIDSTNWWKVLQRRDARLVRVHPDSDRTGRLALLVLQLAERQLGQPDLATKLLGRGGKPLVRSTTSSALALLRADSGDFAWARATEAAAAGVPALRMPPEIDLSDPAHAPLYARARTVSPGAAPGDSTVVTGAPLAFVLSIPTDAANPAVAARFIRFLLSEDGSRLLRTGHLRPLARRVAVGNGVPSLVAASVDTVVTVPDSVIATPDSVLAPITRRR
jgi:molybdate/tungstate transport system substrate-binding protein